MDESRLPRNPPSGLLPPFQSQLQASEFLADNQRRGLLIEFMGSCPKRCRLYQPNWRAKLSWWRRNRHPVIWFERQPWQVKVALIAALVVLVAIYQGSRHPGAHYR